VSRDLDDRFAVARAVADAVLYEGYVLYPYRASARKNQLRWQFGVLVPRGFAAAEPSERWSMRTECLVDPGAAPAVAVRMRCLHAQHRSVEAAVAGAPNGYEPTDELEVDGTAWVAWDEAVEQVVDVPAVSLLPVAEAAEEVSFHLAGGEEVEEVRSASGVLAGRIVRRREPVDGRIKIDASWAEGADLLVKLGVEVDNSTPWSAGRATRDVGLRHSLIAAHVMLAVDDGVFVSLLDPPEAAGDAASGCVNEGAFPVLIGGDSTSRVLLSSPIILYDNPQVAPESVGELYDATEIDEILALRVLTLTDQEKAEARATDPRSAAIIDHCDNLPPELWARLHGAVRSLGPPASETVAPSDPSDPADPSGPEPVPWWDPGADDAVDPWTDAVTVAGVELAKGSAVRLRPSRRADSHDLFLAGQTATVAGVFTDVDGTTHVAVSLDADPATELLAWHGRYLYFHPDELEPLGGNGDDEAAAP